MQNRTKFLHLHQHPLSIIRHPYPHLHFHFHRYLYPTLLLHGPSLRSAKTTLTHACLAFSTNDLPTFDTTTSYQIYRNTNPIQSKMRVSITDVTLLILIRSTYFDGLPSQFHSLFPSLLRANILKQAYLKTQRQAPFCVSLFPLQFDNSAMNG
jgi:hypothetical protein